MSDAAFLSVSRASARPRAASQRLTAVLETENNELRGDMREVHEGLRIVSVSAVCCLLITFHFNLSHRCILPHYYGMYVLVCNKQKESVWRGFQGWVDGPT